MNRVLLAVATFISMISLTNSGFAVGTDEGYLEVNFQNNTDYDCKITAPDKPRYGGWYGKPPKSIAAHHSGIWLGRQDNYHYHGPNMSVVLKCGGYSLSLKNQQNYSLCKGGKQHFSYTADKHLTVSYKQTRGASYHSHECGVADVTVSFNG
ncbi:hypothetical protein [Candidatus Sororendozoicomonas aggregata]|uniref:hypothetical protein n=1 Tax=Candidatus Sororendozoicomonas aggregata TaxID=3073239 RepID=UPI002ED310B5